ncbi:glycosyltransferase family protein [Yoonia sediminilitoris]|uniref:Glycosyltransferase involved in cell wall biosynthesis n=1 Tax=Yoonia sediminilitoris TaxID=1286148 RepID=A0A2T6KN33_9RHOB|nr:glycosyltransferase [Yoonia sediminilitoris]PUB17574.1 glycosyltransferase involved in cell wall biosynthesis [Yoonia sediminilitoris]RCW97869.1 glycosyltransferase involved in cell wall biosynthesis [Yoonia sediminilitoris]
MDHFDIVHAADPRFRGGTASALRTEIVAAHRWGLKSALLPYHGMKERPCYGFAPRVQAAVAALDFPMLSYDAQATCEILLAHHPFVFQNLPLQRPRLQPRKVVAVLHHPPLDGRHHPQYDTEKLIAALEASYCAPVFLAPVGPIVRQQLLEIGVSAERIVRHDFLNIVDETEWPARTRPAPVDQVVIGRHSRKDPLKWPDDATDCQAAYPVADNITIRILGEAYLPQGMEWPRNMYVQEFTETGVADFLAGLDFYVYFHSSRWVEAFGLAIAEAMASGLVVILPPRFRQLFGDGAVYAHPDEVMSVIDRFRAQPDDYRRQSLAARRIVHTHYAIKSYGKRMQELAEDIGARLPYPLRLKSVDTPPPAVTTQAKMPAGPARTRVLMVASNGIGLGHVTRLMAIAKHLPDWIEPVFLTLSLATSIVRKAGYSADYIPSFGKSGVTESSWNDVFALELLAALDATGAQGVVFDSNHPFPGLMTVLNKRTDLSWVWVRRGLWQPHHKLDPGIEKSFDLVLEPGEMARDHDHGPTAQLRGALRVGPVLLVEPGEALDREAAAAALDLDPKRCNVAVQLGSRQNMDFAQLRAQIANSLLQQDVSAIEIVNPLAKKDDGMGLPQRQIYPLARYGSAIDLLITTAGYNGFHESVYGGIPTLFVPNEAPEMDHQHVRAHFAAVSGLAACIRNSDAPRLDATLGPCLTADFRAQVKAAAGDLPYESGGRQAAVAIAEQLASVRTNRPLGLALARSG